MKVKVLSKKFIVLMVAMMMVAMSIIVVGNLKGLGFLNPPQVAVVVAFDEKGKVATDEKGKGGGDIMDMVILQNVILGAMWFFTK